MRDSFSGLSHFNVSGLNPIGIKTVFQKRVRSGLAYKKQEVFFYIRVLHPATCILGDL